MAFLGHFMAGAKGTAGRILVWPRPLSPVPQYLSCMKGTGRARKGGGLLCSGLGCQALQEADCVTWGDTSPFPSFGSFAPSVVSSVGFYVGTC